MQFKKLLLLIVAFQLCAGSAFALELDMSVDEEIRKNYNPSKLELEQLPSIPETEHIQQTTLPALPKTTTTTTPKTSNTVTIPPAQTTTSTQPVQPPKTTPVIDYSQNTGKVKNYLPNTSAKNDLTAIKIKKGTKFTVKSQTKVSDWNSAGAGMTFVSTNLVTQRYITLPAGTVFRGIVVESHQPQASGNGGLLVLKATSIQYKGKTYNIDAKITKANSKKIFFNNIKGERKYWKNVGAQIDKGEQIYQKSRKTSTKLSNNPIGVFVSPFPTIGGVIVYAVNLVGSPLLAIGAKGGHITIPAGTMYEIKLREDAYVY